MADLDEDAMAKLAREMAMDIRNYKDIFADFGISEEDYYEIAKTRFYMRAKEQFATRVEQRAVGRTTESGSSAHR